MGSSSKQRKDGRIVTLCINFPAHHSPWALSLWPFIPSCNIPSFNKHLLNTCYVPSNVLYFGAIKVNKTKSLSPWKFHSLNILCDIGRKQGISYLENLGRSMSSPLSSWGLWRGQSNFLNLNFCIWNRNNYPSHQSVMWWGSNKMKIRWTMKH